ncbi:MAG TPA: cellulase family glycosylhydrolase [Lentzea sp.]
MRKRFWALGVAAAAVVASALVSQAAPAATGLHISGRDIVEANGQKFILRGVNHEHVWFQSQTKAFADVKALGANTVRVVLGSGKRWGPSNDVSQIIGLCKQNRMICVLEVHDTTGYGEEGAAASLDDAVNYWISQKTVLAGQEDYVIINIGNEPIGNTNPAQWTDATVNAVRKMRANGFGHLLMVDAPNWGQDWQNVMRANAPAVWNADERRNTVFSIHMYSVYSQASTITAYFDAFQNMGLPLVVGEFGWRFASGEVDHETVLAEAQRRGLGYLGWSWAGNNDPVLDMAANFDATRLTTWGDRIFNGANGIKATSKEATIFGGVPPTTPPPGKACTAAYSIAGQWPGGFQGDVKVTAGGTAVSGWTVTWTFVGGQSVTQAWNATVSGSGSSVTAVNVAHNGTLAAGASATFGFLGSWSGTNPVPAVTCTAR